MIARPHESARACYDDVMTAGLESVLAEAGLKIDPGKFLRLVADAARKVSPPQPNPADYFSPEQRQVLTDVGLDLSAYDERETDPRASTVATRAVFADSSYSVTEAARLLGIDSSRVRHRLKEDKLTGWKDKGWQLPAWQFSGSAVLPGLDVVLPALPDDQPPLMVAAFMNTPQPDLEIDSKPVTPRQWLLAHGDPHVVAELATTLGTAA